MDFALMCDWFGFPILLSQMIASQASDVVLQIHIEVI